MIDIVVIGVVLIMVFIGYHVGLIQTVLSFASHFISLAVSWTLHPIVSRFILKIGFVKNIEKVIRQHVGSIRNNVDSTHFSPQIVLNEIKLPYIINGFLNGMISKVVGDVFDIFVNQLIVITVNIISMTVVFALCNIIVGFVFKSLQVVTRIPIVRHFDRFGGGLFGVVEGMFLIYLFFVLVTAFSLTGKYHRLQVAIDESYISKRMYYDNLLFRTFLPNYIPKNLNKGLL